MESIEVSSTMIRAIRYDAESKCLEIDFINGGKTYRYSEFPEAEFEAFKNAASFGQFFRARIAGAYPTEKI